MTYWLKDTLYWKYVHTWRKFEIVGFISLDHYVVFLSAIGFHCKTYYITRYRLSCYSTATMNVVKRSPSRHITQQWRRYYVETTSFGRNYIKVTSFDVITTLLLRYVFGEQWLNSQKHAHTGHSRAIYGVSWMSVLQQHRGVLKRDRVVRVRLSIHLWLMPQSHPTAGPVWFYHPYDFLPVRPSEAPAGILRRCCSRGHIRLRAPYGLARLYTYGLDE